MSQKKTALVLFAGSGGLSRGLHDEGFDALGLDVDPLCIEDHRKIAGPCEEADLMTLGPADLRAMWAKHFGPSHPGPDLLATSPPCKSFSGCLPTALSMTEKYQGLSSLAMRGLWLALEAFPLHLPKLILLENVPRMKTRGAEWLDQITRLLQSYGYAVNLETHDCGEYGGLAQVRRRLLLVARHRPQLSDLTPWPKPPKKKHKAIRDALACLPVPLYRDGGVWDGGALHRPVRCSALTWLRLALVPEGKDWRSIPAEVTLYRTGEGVASEGMTGEGAEDGGAQAEALRDVQPNLGPHAHNGPWGVERWEGVSPTIIGHARAEKGNTTADPRMTCDVRDGAMGVGSWEDRFRTAVISRGIPQNGPWQVADPRGGSVRVDGYVVGASVWLRPGFTLDLEDKRAVQVVLLTWNDKKRRWAWHRPLTTMELAALQGLTTHADGEPLTLAGKSHTTYREHIGNMVPPPAARAIGKAAMRCLTSGGWLLMGPGEEVWVDGDAHDQDDGVRWEDALAALARSVRRGFLSPPNQGPHFQAPTPAMQAAG